MNSPIKSGHIVKTTVGAIILKEDRVGSKVLLTKRGIPPFQGMWCLPGGHIDPNETGQQAIIREVKEEVGLDFDAHFFNYFDEIIPEYNIHAVVLIYTGKVTGELKAQPYEVIELNWFSFVEAQSISLAFQHNRVLDAYQAKLNNHCR